MKKKPILLVENYPSTAETIAEILHDDYPRLWIKRASNSGMAEEMLRKENFSAVITGDFFNLDDAPGGNKAVKMIKRIRAGELDSSADPAIANAGIPVLGLCPFPEALAELQADKSTSLVMESDVQGMVDFIGNKKLDRTAVEAKPAIQGRLKAEVVRLGSVREAHGSGRS